MNTMMKNCCLLFIGLLLLSFAPPVTLKGTWRFAGGIYNGKREDAPKGYALRRVYNAGHYVAFVIEKGVKPEKYETGNYVLTGDTCIDTETFCSQPSKITHIPIHYLYTLRHDTLTLRGTLPTGMRVEEYWKRIK